METNDLRDVLEQVAAGRLSVEVAMAHVGNAAVANLGYANVDLHRRQRCGFPEVIFCEGKTCEWVEGVVRKLIEAGQDCRVPRLGPEPAQQLSSGLPPAPPGPT